MFFMLEVIYTTGTPYETEKFSLRDNTIIFPSTYKQIVEQNECPISISM